MDPILGIAVYIILWWIAFFLMLPIGAKSPHEAGEAAEKGHEPGAPRFHNLGRKAAYAAGVAALLWVVAVFVVIPNVFKPPPPL